ncbi:MAG: AsmA family protein [Bacteroidia bacterium]
MKKRKKVILWFTGSMVFLLGIFSITVFVLLGNVKSFVNQNGQNYIGRKVHVDHINLNLLNAKVVINDLVVYEPNKLDSFLVMQSLGVNINLRSFFNKNYIIDQLKINGLSCKIVQNAGVFNFQDIVDTIKAKTQKDTSQTTEPIKWQISKIDLTNSAITYTDFKLPYPLKFDSLNINSNNGIGSQKSNVEFITDFKFNKSTGVNIAINYTAKNDSLITKLKVKN